jgi:hypothetical protein
MGGLIVLQVRLDKKWDPISQVTRAKRFGGVDQIVECLPCKYETLSSNSTITKKRKRN